jgi:hypothetical protein
MSKIIQDQIINVTASIQQLAEQHDLSIIDACIMYSESANLEIEYVGEIVQKNRQLKNAIGDEARALNFLRE